MNIVQTAFHVSLKLWVLNKLAVVFAPFYVFLAIVVRRAVHIDNIFICGSIWLGQGEDY